MKVLVYGTLKKGYSNHHFMFKSKYIKNTEIKGSLYLKKDRYFPHLILKGEDLIECEIYEVSENCLTYLDRLEGHPNFFERKELEIENEKMFIYEYKIQKNEKIEEFKKIKIFKEK
jgi:gamma-glutamylcyclotransferase (GGCT)/AIG2-like uncharacterized protein YtfP